MPFCSRATLASISREFRWKKRKVAALIARAWILLHTLAQFAEVAVVYERELEAEEEHLG
jgi:hypothetical protein